jgi:hypothetical protein
VIIVETKNHVLSAHSAVDVGLIVVTTNTHGFADGRSKCVSVRRGAQIALNLGSKLVRRQGRLQLGAVTPKCELRHAISIDQPALAIY